MSLEEDFKQLEFCFFKDEIGHPLKNNASYINLKKNVIDNQKILEVIEKFSFDLITDVHHNNSEAKKFTKRKAIFLCHIKKEFRLEK